ncbi:MAG: hypothetical protein WBL40_01995 [Terrimicrobiaceae bacterium]
MSVRPTGLAGTFSLMVLGCAADPSASATLTPEWHARKERQERLVREWRLARDHGRIGYVGNQAPALEGTTVPAPEHRFPARAP